MPIYGYQCEKCGYVFEEMLKMDDRHYPCKIPCKNCGEMGVKMALSPAKTISDVFRQRPSEDWNSFLKELKRKNPGSNVDTW